MEPIDYIKKFRMDQENYQFSRQDFINQLENDFLESIYTCQEPKMENGFPEYEVFKSKVSNIEAKFNKISELLPVKLHKGLWNYFFAYVVVKYRRKYYPEIQAIIDKAKRNPN